MTCVPLCLDYPHFMGSESLQPPYAATCSTNGDIKRGQFNNDFSSLIIGRERQIQLTIDIQL